MKKIILSLLAVSAFLSSCSFEDEPVRYTYTSLLFANQTYNRNIVVGEGLQIGIGVNLAGLAENPSECGAHFEIDPSLVGAGKTLLPADYYTLSNPNYISVPAGQLRGFVYVKIDSTKFLNDPKALTGEYVLPVKLTEPVGVDQLNETKNYIAVSISYYAKQFGNYHYEGAVTRTVAGVEQAKEYYQHNALVTESIRSLTTVGPTKLRVSGDTKGSNDPLKGHSFLINVPTFNGGTVTIEADPSSDVAVTADGTSSYDVAAKTFTLNYQFTTGDGTVNRISEKLTFRNRIRDVNGNRYLNEWQGDF